MGIVVGKYETAVMLPVKKREARTIAQRWLTQKADQALAQEWLQGKAQNAAGIKPAEATEPVEPVEPPLLMAPVPSPKTNVLKDLTDAQISDVFNRFDTDLNGYLDTFELADAVNELTGQVLSTGQTMHLVEKYELANTERDPPNSLTELEFGDMVRTIDWDSDDWRKAGGSPLRGTVATSGADQPNGTPYEVVFEQNTLGFRVRTDTTRGLVVVNQVTDPLNLGVIFVGDLLVAVNGAPLGYILDHKVLAKKIKSLGRPMKITFEVSLEGRNAALRERPDTADPEIALNPAKTWSDEKLKRVFLDFDRDQSDSLDTFELGPALTELLGRDFDSGLVAELVTKYDTNGSNTIEFDEFLIMIRSIDTATLDVPTTPQRPATAGGSIDADTFEVTFRKSSLGFRVRNDTERGLIIIKELIKPHAPSTPGTPGMPGTPSTPGGSKGRGDHLDPRVVPGLIVFAVNGAPMGWVNHHKVLAEKIRGLDRPIRVTFKRDIEGGSAKPAQPVIEETQETQAEEK
uniref:EF-hand domain-containing protein n=1 Tax=Florenciella parvula TaxID=236787 RepID=A0A7S2CIF3_9STRA